MIGAGKKRPLPHKNREIYAEDIGGFGLEKAGGVLMYCG